MTANIEQNTFPHERKIKKFLKRADTELSNPLFSAGRERYSASLTFSLDKKIGNTSTQLGLPDSHSNAIKDAIADCSPFFLQQEDSYLPGAVKTLGQVSTRGHAIALKDSGLKKFVGQFIANDYLVGGGFMYSGRLDADNGAGAPGKLLTSGRIAMDYLYGAALPEDDDKIARQENVSKDDTVLHAVAMVLANLMHAVAVVREQIRSSATNGYLAIEVHVGRPTEWSEPDTSYNTPAQKKCTS